ncbi:MAG: DUF2007 domain-containing protein [Bacteroidales bacterium]|nr:DUF2007 domain-containing protein [Bacteroidales bacterium]
MANDPVRIYSTGKPYLAELIRQMLSHYDILSFIVNKQDSAYKIGDIEIYVYQDDVLRAKKLIREFEEA